MEYLQPKEPQKSKYYIKYVLIGVALGIILDILFILEIDWLQGALVFVFSVPAILQLWFKINSEFLSLLLAITYFACLCIAYGGIRLLHRRKKVIFTIILAISVLLLHLAADISFTKIFGGMAENFFEYWLGNR